MTIIEKIKLRKKFFYTQKQESQQKTVIFAHP